MSIPSRRVAVVTGAAGFVGRTLVRRLLGEGDFVRGIVLPGDPRAQELSREASVWGDSRLQIVEGDVTEYGSIDAAFSGAERVFHTAALIHAWAPYDRFHRVNVGGAQNVARAVLENGVSRLVVLSTSDVFGIPAEGELLDESSPFRPWGEPYADTKIEAERWLWQCQRSRSLPLVVIYPGWVYGPGDRAFFPGLAEAIATGSMMFWHPGARLPWVYVDNLVDACLLASTAPETVGNGYLVHEGTDGPTLQDVCGRIADAIGARRPRLQIPYRAAYTAAWLAQMLWRVGRFAGTPPLLTVDVKAFGFQWRLSNHKAREQLGWTPRILIEEGMQHALDDLVARCTPKVRRKT